MRPGLVAPERDLLRMLPAQARGLLGPHEPAARRLFPVAYADDAAAQAEYRDMAGDHLLEHHRHTLEVLERTVDAPWLDDDDLRAWLGALEVLRLVLGTDLDVTEDAEELDPADPRADRYAVYQYLSMLQGEVVDALVAALP